MQTGFVYWEINNMQIRRGSVLTKIFIYYSAVQALFLQCFYIPPCLHEAQHVYQ